MGKVVERKEIDQMDEFFLPEIQERVEEGGREIFFRDDLFDGIHEAMEQNLAHECTPRTTDRHRGRWKGEFVLQIFLGGAI
jgi:hypothetical protein